MKPVDVLILAITVAGVAVFIAAVFWLVAHVGGWASLAQKYPAQPSAPDAERGFGSLTLGFFCNYSNCIRWRSDDAYLHLSVLPLFALFHPAVSLPWLDAEITVSRWGCAVVNIAGRRLSVSRRMVEHELRNRALLAEPTGEESAQNR